MLRMPPTLRYQIERAASDEGRSVANLTRRILERWVAEREARNGSLAEHAA